MTTGLCWVQLKPLQNGRTLVQHELTVDPIVDPPPAFRESLFSLSKLVPFPGIPWDHPEIDKALSCMIEDDYLELTLSKSETARSPVQNNFLKAVEPFTL